MAYTAEISRANPTCFLFLLDQSGSMQDFFPGTSRRKADLAADTINRLLQELVVRCAKSEGVRNYYDVGVIGYGDQVSPAFGGALAGRELVPIREIADNPARIEERSKKVEDGAGGLVDQIVKFPIWFDPVASNGTPMCQATSLAYKILSGWLKEHPDCFPPVVMHITDGESTDGDPSENLLKLSRLASTDGNVLLFNIHLSSSADVQPISFPATPAGLPDQYAHMLFNTSSVLPPFYLRVAKDYGFDLSEGARSFVLNADATLAIMAMEIGTRPSNLR